MGLDNIDLDAASRRDIAVRNVDDFCISEVADHAVAMTLNASRRLGLLDRAVKSGQWAPDLEPAPEVPRK
jgi:D-3-phosphoglycerate dehydrogenase